ncbi:permease [Halorutilales archaeon Cl-col2-1]
MIPSGYETALAESWDYFLHLAAVLIPLFIGASFLVGLVQEYLPPERVESILRERNRGSGNVAAAGLGAITPFCSCSTVPVLAGLLGAGAPLGLSFSFLLASPIVNEIAAFLLLGLFGPKITAIYLVSAIVAAIVGGIVIDSLGLGHMVKDVKITAGGREISTDGGTASASCACSSATQKTHREKFETAARGAGSFFKDTFPYLVLGMVLGALIHGAVPKSVLQDIAGPGNPLAVPVAALAGAPLYVSISGMLPIAHSLTQQGIPIGTVIAFVIGGAGVSIPNLILLNKIFEKKLLAVYATTVVTIGVTVGFGLNFLFA